MHLETKTCTHRGPSGRPGFDIILAGAGGLDGGALLEDVRTSCFPYVSRFAIVDHGPLLGGLSGS